MKFQDPLNELALHASPCTLLYVHPTRQNHNPELSQDPDVETPRGGITIHALRYFPSRSAQRMGCRSNNTVLQILTGAYATMRLRQVWEQKG